MHIFFRINVIVRRLGGGYGGKISRASQIACSAALVAHLLKKPCRFILPLVTNMKSIGMRLPLNSKFEVSLILLCTYNVVLFLMKLEEYLTYEIFFLHKYNITGRCQ